MLDNQNKNMGNERNPNALSESFDWLMFIFASVAALIFRVAFEAFYESIDTQFEQYPFIYWIPGMVGSILLTYVFNLLLYKESMKMLLYSAFTGAIAAILVFYIWGIFFDNFSPLCC